MADRFHLLTNVRAAVEKVLSRVGPDIRAANAAASAPAANPSPTAPAEQPVPSDSTAAVPAPPPTPEPEGKPPTATEQRREESRRVREERFERVKELLADGPSCREVARRLGWDLKVVLRRRRPDRCPDGCPGRPPAPARDPFAAFVAEWVAAGNRNGADLFRVLKAKGYTGGHDAVRRDRSRPIGRGGRPGRRNANARPPARKAPSARRLSFRVVNPKADSPSMRVPKRVRQGNAAVHAALEAAEESMAMIRKKSAATLADWLAKAAGGRDRANLAASLRSDAAAVQAALTEARSNRPVEGRVGRLKGIRRQMYGRAGMKLLRARVRHKG